MQFAPLRRSPGLSVLPRVAAARAVTTLRSSGLSVLRNRAVRSSSSSVLPSDWLKHLASNLQTSQDIEDLVITFAVPNAAFSSASSPVRPLAVVKVGGEVITKDLANLVSSLSFLRGFGVNPVVVHGGGPQLNDELAKAGVKPDYIGGGSLPLCAH